MTSALVNKQEKRSKTLAATLHLAARLGVNKVSISQVARISGVSRAWIYKYVGKNKNDLLKFAMAEFGNKIVPKHGQWPKEKNAMLRRFNEGVDLLWSVEPELLNLYIKNFSSDSELGKFIRSTEKAYSKELGLAIEKSNLVTNSEAELVSALFVFLRMAAVHYARERKISKEELARALVTTAKMIHNG